MADWQPIESAPKDGTRILIVGEYGQRVIAWWREDAQFGRFEARPGWQVVDCEDAFYSYAEEPGDVTHWMPLPDPPTVKK